MNIKDFFEKQSRLSKKQKRKFVKLFVGKDRDLVEQCLNECCTKNECELLHKWQEN